MSLNTFLWISFLAVCVALYLTQRRLKIRRLFSFGFSLALIVVAVTLFYSKLQFMASAIRTQGVVTEHYLSDYDQPTTHCFKITFQDQVGRSYRMGAGFCSSTPLHRVGDNVAVAYPPSNPLKAKVASDQVFYFWPTAIGLLGIMLLALESYQAFRERS